MRKGEDEEGKRGEVERRTGEETLAFQQPATSPVGEEQLALDHDGQRLRGLLWPVI